MNLYFYNQGIITKIKRENIKIRENFYQKNIIFVGTKKP